MKNKAWAMVLLLVIGILALPGYARADTNRWSPLALQGVEVGPVISDPARPETLYAATVQGVQKSMDSGKTWSVISKELPNKQGSALVINPVNSQMIYIAYDGEGIFQSTDGGITWTSKNDGLASLNVRCLVFHPKDPNTLYAGIKGGVCITNNGGKQWSPTSGFKNYTNVNAIAINPQDPTIVFAGTGNEGVYKSTNGGVSWKDSNNGLSVLSVLSLSLDPANPQRLIAGTYNAVTPTDLYVGGVYGGIFYTKDGGETWVASKRLSSVTVFALQRLPQKPSVIYASTLGGIYRSIDDGLSWTDINAGLANEFLHNLCVVPMSNQVVLLSSTPNGIFTYTDTEWNTMKAHLSTVSTWIWYAGGGGVLAVLVVAIIVFRLRRQKQNKKKYVW